MKIWFQNRRVKHKKEESGSGEHRCTCLRSCSNRVKEEQCSPHQQQPHQHKPPQSPPSSSSPTSPRSPGFPPVLPQMSHQSQMSALQSHLAAHYPPPVSPTDLSKEASSPPRTPTSPVILHQPHLSLNPTSTYMASAILNSQHRSSS